MTEEFVIGLDSSTTSTKAIAFNKKGAVVANAHESISLSSPKPNYYEQDPYDWWLSTQKVLRKITQKIKPELITAIAISNQRETFVPLDKKGEYLRLAIIWLDERCKNEVEPFAHKVGKDKIHKISGKPVDYAPVVYRLAWMKKHEPNLFRKIAMICDVQTYLIWKLTGEFKTSWTSADPFGLFDLKNKQWSPDILNALELTDTQLAKIFAPGTLLGYISKEASKLTGLTTGTLMIAGGGDGQSAGLGVNALTTERAYLNLGTAVVLGVYGSKYRISDTFRTMGSCSATGYYYECSLRAGTFAIDWFIKNILKINPVKEPKIYQQLEKEAQKTETGSAGLLFLPYLNGVMNPYWDIHARGAFIGLSSSHHRGHMYRAILEGIAFEQLFALKAVEKAAGSYVKELVTIGGGSKSYFWCQIIADITGKTICLPENTEASALGAGIAAAVGAGWYPTFKKAAGLMTGKESIIKPDCRKHEIYQSIFKSYQNIYLKLK